MLLFLGSFGPKSYKYHSQFSVPTAATIAFGLCLLDVPLRLAGQAWECDLETGVWIINPSSSGPKLRWQKGSSQETKANLTLEGLSALFLSAQFDKLQHTDATMKPLPQSWHLPVTAPQGYSLLLSQNLEKLQTRDLNYSGLSDLVLICLRTAEKPLGLTASERRLTVPKDFCYWQADSSSSSNFSSYTGCGPGEPRRQCLCQTCSPRLWVWVPAEWDSGLSLLPQAQVLAVSCNLEEKLTATIY